MGDQASWTGGILAFMAFCVVASSVYLVNDLLDLAADRAHPHKRRRPFASGTAPLPVGIGLSLLLLLAGGVVAWLASILAVVAAYAGLSLNYSLWLKRQPLVDVFTLAGLYTIRLIGAARRPGTRSRCGCWRSRVFCSLAWP